MLSGDLSYSGFLAQISASVFSQDNLTNLTGALWTLDAIFPQKHSAFSPNWVPLLKFSFQCGQSAFLLAVNLKNQKKTDRKKGRLKRRGPFQCGDRDG